MDNSSEYYSTIINQYNANAEKTAKDLYNSAINGDITYTEAWTSLPGPSPQVSSNRIAHTTFYNVTYRFLSNQEATTLYERSQGELASAISRKEKAYTQSKQNEIQQEQTLKGKVETSRKKFDEYAANNIRLETKIEELREQLQNWEKAYKKNVIDLENAKQEKESAEKEQYEYLQSTTTRRKNEQVESEAELKLLHTRRNEGEENQKRQTDAYNKLWEGKQHAIKKEKEQEEETKRIAYLMRMKEIQQQQRIHQIEEEAKRRIKDAEFEELVRKRMNELSN